MLAPAVTGARVDIVGWSQSGGTALIDHREIGCEDKHWLELWRQGRDQPVGCVDLYATQPDRRVECDMATGPDSPRMRPRISPQPSSFFPVAVERDPSNVMARYNLVCALVVLGQVESGFAILETFAGR